MTSRTSSGRTWRGRRRSSPKPTSVSNNVLARGALAGLHVVVTGSSGGIGRAIAARLLTLDAVVHGFDRSPPTQVSDGRDHPVTVDLTDGAQTTKAARALTRIDALVHAAGVMRVGRVGALDPADGETMWSIRVE